MKVLFDTNVVLDAMLERDPFVDHAARLVQAVESGLITGYLGATTLTTVYYIATKNATHRDAILGIGDLLSLFEVAVVDGAVLRNALLLDFVDYEDAVLHEAGRVAGVDSIVTRYRAGFANSRIRVNSPAELLGVLNARHG